MSEYKLQYTAKQINEKLSMATIRGSGAPTISTEGAVGCFYMNTDNGDVYKCVSVANGMFVWVNADNTVSDAVKYTAQTLTEEQKTQVRENIGAMPADAKMVTSINGMTGALNITELPAVTASDNGKFLRVSAEGKWVAQTILNAEEVAF